MYLISLYLDEKSSTMLNNYIYKLEKQTKNNYLSSRKIPVHLTLATLHDIDSQTIINILDSTLSQFKQGTIDIVSIGVFSKNTLFLTPLYNQYLHDLSLQTNNLLEVIDKNRSKNRYRPFHWFPHITIARKLNEKQLMIAFQTINSVFQPITATITKIALSSSNPYQDINVWNLNKDKGE